MASGGDCTSAGAAAGSLEVTNLGGGDADGETGATAAFTVTAAAAYVVCYKRFGATYAAIGAEFPVTAAGASSPRRCPAAPPPPKTTGPFYRRFPPSSVPAATAAISLPPLAVQTRIRRATVGP